jgi:S1-C subfamily serine protease
LGLVLRTASASVRFLHVEKVLPGGPAFQAGVRPLDVIAQIDGSPIQFRDDLAVLEYLHGLRPGQRVRLMVNRGSQTIRIVTTVAPFPPEYRDAWLRIYAMVRGQSRRASIN